MNDFVERPRPSWLHVVYWLSLAIIGSSAIVGAVELIAGILQLVPGTEFATTMAVSIPLQPAVGTLAYSGPHIAIGSTVTLTQAAVTVADAPILAPIAKTISDLIVASTVGLVAFGVSQVLRDARTGRPFSRRSHASLGLIAITLAVGPALSTVSIVISQAALGGVQYIAAHGEWTVDVSRFNIDWYPVLASLGLAALSVIFRNAISMQDEMDALI